MKHPIIVFFLSLIVLIGWSNACFVKDAVQTHPAQLSFEQLPLKKLSDYGFFKGDLKATETIRHRPCRQSAWCDIER